MGTREGMTQGERIRIEGRTGSPRTIGGEQNHLEEELEGTDSLLE